MYEVTITRSFSAAHALAIGGACEELHGHNFSVAVSVAADELSPEGLVVDFRQLKDITDEVIAKLDHTYLNDVPALKDINPTSENLARYIYDEIAGRLKTDKRCRVAAVTVGESDTARATYRG